MEKILEELDGRLGTVPHQYIAVSPLADGADRLVATCVLAWNGKAGNQTIGPSKLEVTLPMPPADDIATFDPETRTDSEREFNALLARAAQVTVLPEGLSHKAAYKQVGQRVVDGCDILIAIWDGEPARGEGGTAQIVGYAEENDRSTFWINPVSGSTKLLTTPRGFVNQTDLLSEYEAELPAGKRPLADEVERRLRGLQRDWERAGLDSSVLEPLKFSVLPQFVKATTMAAKYRRRYFNSVTLGYWLSAAAVFCAATGALFFPERPWLFVIELVLILFATAMVWPSRFERSQRKWVDYRYLAERLRSSYFLYLAELGPDISQSPPDLELSSLPANWTDVVVQDAWKDVPPFEISVGTANEIADMRSRVSAFLREAWIENQVSYYDRAAHRNLRSRERSEMILKGIVAFVLVAAMPHIVLPGVITGFDRTPWSKVLSVLAVTLPAVASVFAGISVFRNSSRNAERYANMGRHLKTISRRMSDENQAAEGVPHEPPALTRLQRLMREADLAMMHEHRSWRSVFGVRLPGPG